MNTLLKQLAEKASDLGSLAQSIAESGVKSVSELFGVTKIFRSLTATSTEQVAHDETHYFLVPVLGSPPSYAVYTKRILPPDTGATNSLPKARIFHVPDETGKKLLEQRLVENLVVSGIDASADASPLADALEKVADQIDKETDKISGGLVLIGGAVAIVNPLLGIGIAVKALLPSIGAKATKAGAEFVGSKLRQWNRSSTETKLRKQATDEVQKLKPSVYPNPILRSLDAIASNPKTDFDPAVDHRNWVDQFGSIHYYQATVEAIKEVYDDVFRSAEFSGYQESHLRWIRTLL